MLLHVGSAAFGSTGGSWFGECWVWQLPVWHLLGLVVLVWGCWLLRHLVWRVLYLVAVSFVVRGLAALLQHLPVQKLPAGGFLFSCASWFSLVALLGLAVAGLAVLGSATSSLMAVGYSVGFHHHCLPK